MRLAVGTEFRAKAALFDMDGTLVNSTAVVERIWKRSADRWGADFETMRINLHGRRAVDLMREINPPAAVFDAEVAIVDEAELTETDGIVPIPGAAELLAALPPTAWVLVTSARPDLAIVRVRAAGLPAPLKTVNSADVTHGKPHPECFLRGCEILGVAPHEAVVLEDAPAGFAAGKAAGCRVVGLATTMAPERLDDVDWIPDLSVLHVVEKEADGWMLFRITG